MRKVISLIVNGLLATLLAATITGLTYSQPHPEINPVNPPPEGKKKINPTNPWMPRLIIIIVVAVVATVIYLHKKRWTK